MSLAVVKSEMSTAPTATGAPKSDGKCQQRSNLQKWIAVINTPRTDTHRIYAMHTLIMTFTFADLTAVDICHPTKISFESHRSLFSPKRIVI